jgi:hypothetical protein
MANREMLVSTVVEMAHFQVLVMEPPPLRIRRAYAGNWESTGCCPEARRLPGIPKESLSVVQAQFSVSTILDRLQVP